MTVSHTRPSSPNTRLRQRLAASRGRACSETGALSAEFAVLMCVGAGLAFALYKFAAGGGLITALVGVILGVIKGLLGGIG